MIIFTNMDIQLEKYALIEELTKVKDVNLIRAMKKMLQKRDEIVGYKSDGSSIAQSEMQSDILDAKNRILSGEFTTQEDMEKESESW